MNTIQNKFGRFHPSTGSTSQSQPATAVPDDARSKRIRERAGRFRILVIGRANAGKTTILQKVCNTSEQPEIFNSEGEKIDISVVNPTKQRGEHDIENELVFQSNRGFIFHDSRGFEAGGTAELDTVKRFIMERSKLRDLRRQLHVIWYCIPMDDDRPFTTAEINFFSKCGTGRVPVVVIFTKFDALEDKAYGELDEQGVSHEDAVAQAPTRAVTDFETKHLPYLYKQKYPPKGHVYLRDMNKPDADCRELTKTVAKVLDSGNLQQLFVSTQQNNLEICMMYAVKNTLTPVIITKARQLTATISMEFQQDMMEWYPNFWAVNHWFLSWRILAPDHWFGFLSCLDRLLGGGLLVMMLGL